MKMKKIVYIFCLLYILPSFLNAESEVKNYVFAQRDTCSLSMNVYTPINITTARPCLVFVFGGGFMRGSKSDKYDTPFLKAMADSGYVVAAIDYRLGMKNIKTKNKINAIQHAIEIAVEDLYSATGYLLVHSASLKIDPQKIIICGSSAGAITVLQADYELANQMKPAKVLPANFHFAAVISFAGGIFSLNGIPVYHENPAPTLFFHGVKDQLVNYNYIQIGKKGFFGSNALVKQFEKYDYPYFIYRYRDMGHEIAEIPMTKNLEDIFSFIRDYVIDGRKLKKDMTIKDPDVKAKPYGRWRPEDLYK
jgi:dipeptidyl aminopeptidase/acylaminoacyl peptidase